MGLGLMILLLIAGADTIAFLRARQFVLAYLLPRQTPLFHAAFQPVHEFPHAVAETPSDGPEPALRAWGGRDVAFPDGAWIQPLQSCRYTRPE